MRHWIPLLVLPLLAAPPARAAWTPSGLSLCQTCRANGLLITSNSAGGAFVAWTDTRNSPSGFNDDIFMQHVTSTGDVAVGWPGDGLPVCTVPRPQLLSSIDTDGSGGALLAWLDYRSPQSGTDIDIFAQRVLPNGGFAAGWPVDGAPVSRAPGTQDAPYIVGDGAGGAYVTWDAYDSSQDIFLQHLTFSGGVWPGWPEDGLPISTLPVLQAGPIVISDGQSGALIAWGDFRAGPVTTFAQRVMSDGQLSPGWPTDGRPIIANRYMRELYPDGTGGAYLSCAAAGSFLDGGYYLQRFGGDGSLAPGWPANGAPVSLVTGDRNGLHMAPDGFGGMLLAWTEYHAPMQENFVQHVQPDGSRYPGWPAEGLRVATNSGFDVDCHLAADGAGGAFLTWVRQVNSRDDVYVQHIRSDGTLASGWPAEGRRIPTVRPGELGRIVSDGAGGAIVACVDYDQRVWAFHLGPDGPVAVQVSLLSAEPGPGWVRLSWLASDGTALRARVERRSATGDWEVLAELTADGSGRFVYEDRDVTAGGRYAYRLSYTEGATTRTTSEAWVDVPAGAHFALRGIAPNPSPGDGLISFSLAGDGPAMLEVFDVRGRRVVAREVGSLGAGSHALKMNDGTPRLSAGVYTIRLSQAGLFASTRAVVMR